MKAKLSAFVIIGLIFLNVNSAYSIPRPCTQEELLKTSHYAIEGYVVSVECQEAYDSEECKPQSESREFKPELVSNCIATIEVSKSLKGNYNVGDKLKIPFLKLFQECRNGSHIIPGSPKKDLKLNSGIRYYNSSSCVYWNLEEIEKSTPEP